MWGEAAARRVPPALGVRARRRLLSRPGIPFLAAAGAAGRGLEELMREWSHRGGRGSEGGPAREGSGHSRSLRKWAGKGGPRGVRIEP